MGLYFSLAERCEFATYGMIHAGGGTHINHVFSSLPAEAFVAGGSPTRSEWNSISDHLSVCASFFIKQLQGLEGRGRRKTYKVKPNPSFRIKDPRD
jgi:hypothetical protein